MATTTVNAANIKNPLQQRLFKIYTNAGFSPLTAAFIVLQNILETANFTSNIFKTNNNIGGVTWSANLGAKGYIKGSARPKSEGGNYVKFLSPELCAEFIAGLYKNRFAPATDSTTISHFVDTIKAKGYFTSPAAEYKSFMSGQKNKNLDAYLKSVIDSPTSFTDALKKKSSTKGSGGFFLANVYNTWLSNAKERLKQ